MSNTPNPIDVHVGARIKLRRQLQGLSQTELAGCVDLTFQQIQKYERGTNRVSASKLFSIAQALDVPVSFFFDGLGARAGDPPPALSAAAVRAVAALDRIPDERQRANAVRILEALAEPQETELVDAAVIARSVLYCGGLVEASERLAFKKLTNALGARAVNTEAMRSAAARAGHPLAVE